MHRAGIIKNPVDSERKTDEEDQVTINRRIRMKLENTKAQMRKGVLEYCILLVLKGEPLYASNIIEALKEAKMIVVEGTLYPLLTRLKNAGLLKYRWEESTQGPPRKYYELTDKGKNFLGELEGSWSELVEAVEKIKKTEQFKP
jgi:PadR family transcriptional regulator, regulatory protein PadR